MRWTTQEPPEDNDTRIKSGFLFFPKGIDRKWRWLEFAVWKDRFHEQLWESGGWWGAIEWIGD